MQVSKDPLAPNRPSSADRPPRHALSAPSASQLSQEQILASRVRNGSTEVFGVTRSMRLDTKFDGPRSKGQEPSHIRRCTLYI